MENKLEFAISGNISFDDGNDLPYSVPAFTKEKILPRDQTSIVKITGKSREGVVCTPFMIKGDEEPKQKFHVVAGGGGDGEGCIILPASEQYHPIQSVQWRENGELVKQKDFFHPGTKEAILKTPAHGNNKETTMIFQARNSTRGRKSTGFGLMVTAFGGECHVNELNEDSGDIF